MTKDTISYKELNTILRAFKRKVSKKSFDYIQWRDKGYNHALEDLENKIGELSRGIIRNLPK